MKKISLYFGVLVFFLSGCAPTIKEFRYNENIHAYEATTQKKSVSSKNWFVLRQGTDRKKVDNYEIAEALVGNYNGSFFRDIINISLHGNQLPPIAKPYLSGKIYFKAIDLYKQRNYPAALHEFRKALWSYNDLNYISDVNYLMGLCSKNSGDLESAEFYFQQFMDYSESICPKTFNLDYQNSQNFDTLLIKAEIPEDHFSCHYDRPALYQHYFPGYISPYGNRINIGLRIGYIYPGKTVGLIELRSILWKDLQYRFGMGNIYQYLRVDYQFYKNSDNTVGILPFVEFSSQDVTFDDGNKIVFYQVNPGIEIGYFPYPRLGLYGGARYYRWNEENKYSELNESGSYQVWNNNELFAGAGIFLLDHFGLLIELTHRGDIHMGIYMSGGQFWFR